MGSRESSIHALLNKAASQLQSVEAEYNKSLTAKTIDPSLRIDIKNLCENLRSVLDYLAADMRERHCPNASSSTRFYFPILPDKQSFDMRLDEWFPGLRKSSPKLAGELESLQPFQAGREWLGQFNRLNNENKHDDLVEQTRIEAQETRVTGRGGASVSWTSGVTFGHGVSIMGVPVDPRTQLPVPDPSIRVDRIKWVDFQFAGIGVSALWLLKKAVSDFAEIERKLRPLL